MSDNEIELSDQDLNILDEFETNFLLNVEKGNLNRRKEIPFTKLPIKNEKGILQRVKENSTIEEKTQLKMVKATMEPSMQVEEIVPETKVEDKEKNVSKKEKKPNLNKTSILEIKESLASTASVLVQDPENEISQLKSLFDYVKDKRPLVVKLSLLTLLSVFKDIIPGYRIRKVPDSEKDVQLSKQVRKLRNFEEALLSNYQNYLILLDVISKENGSKTGGDESLLKISVMCLCELLTTQIHFNFRVNLMTVVIQNLVMKNNQHVSKMCSEAITTVFKNDTAGQVSLECVKLMSQKIHAMKYNVSVFSLEPFLSLRLQSELKQQETSYSEQRNKDKKRKSMENNKQHISKRQKKLNKYIKAAAEEFQEAEATYDKHQIQKNQSESLKHLFMTYFRILKNATKSPLIPSVLEGLAKFARLINIDFFEDLLQVLKKISIEHQELYLSGDEGDSPIAALHCIIAAFELLESVGGALKIDISDFYSSLYVQMSRLSITIESYDNIAQSTRKKTEMQLLLRGIEFMLKKNREIPIERVAAFVKRLATLILVCPSSSAFECLLTLKHALNRFPRLQALLDEDGRVHTGLYNPYMDDPDMCNPFATTMWETSLLGTHYNPAVKAINLLILGKNLSSLQRDIQSTNLDVDKLLKSNTIKTEIFELNPKVKLPTQIIAKSKKTRLDGPFTVFESEFLSSLHKF